MAWAKSRRACCCTIWEPAASHGCSARAAVGWGHSFRVTRATVPTRAPVRVLLDREVPDKPGGYAVRIRSTASWAGVGSRRYLGHTNTLANATDISGEVKRRFLPGLKAGVSMPRS